MKVLLSGSAVFVFSLVALRAEPPATNFPPGPVEPAAATNVQPVTPAPPQANAKSAPGAQSPNGTNGATLTGKPVTKAPNTPKKKKKNPVAASTATATAAQPAPAKKPASVLDNYLKDLGDTLKLSADEKKQIEGYYAADDAELKNILNDGALSPLQQAQQVSALRDRRDDKIEMLLTDPERRGEFFAAEAKYRVALVEAAAKSASIPAPARPAAPPE